MQENIVTDIKDGVVKNLSHISVGIDSVFGNISGVFSGSFWNSIKTKTWKVVKELLEKINSYYGMGPKFQLSKNGCDEGKSSCVISAKLTYTWN
jgi:hypothetical protein